jgi:type II secretory pathway pseudopilin PulG
MKMVLGMAILAILLVIIIPIAVTSKRFYNANKKNKN